MFRRRSTIPSEPKCNGCTSEQVERANGNSSMGRLFSFHLSRSHQNSLLVLVHALAPVHVHVRADRGPSRMAQKKARRLFSPLHPRQPPSPPMQASASNTWGYVSCAVAPASDAAVCRASSNRGRSGGLQSEPNPSRPFSTRARRTRERAP